jgi:hypothetical protein
VNNNYDAAHEHDMTKYMLEQLEENISAEEDNEELEERKSQYPDDDSYDDDSYGQLEHGYIIPYVSDSSDIVLQVVDTEAVAWAYKKLLAYGVGNTTRESALMLDRLNAMLQGY